MNRIAQLRKECQLTQTGLALKLNTTQYMISAYENERHQPSVEMLIQLADFFNVSVDYLIGHSDIRSSKVMKNDGQISNDEIMLINYYNVLSKKQKEIALGTVYALRGYEN